jgi:putative sporulation protein YyaC
MMRHIHYLDKRSVPYLAEALVKHYRSLPACREIVVLGVGTNRCIGDALGPMTGSRLMERFADHRYVRLYGTMDKPVHALNLGKVLAMISARHPRAYVIAVDACLGTLFKVGTLQLVTGPLEPGAGLHKKLPPAGHIHLKGVVNNCSELNTRVLENASLTFIHEMAAVISRTIVAAVKELTPLLLKEPRDHAEKLHFGS